LHVKRFGTTMDGRVFQTARGGILQDSGYSEVWDQARREALTPAQYRSPLGRRPYDLRYAGVSLWLNAGMPAPEVARRAGRGVAVLLKIYAHCIDGQVERSQPAHPRGPRHSGCRGKTLVTRATATSSRRPEMAGQGRIRVRAVCVTAPTGPVHGLFHPRPWAGPCPSVARTAPKSGAHGRIADGGGPESRLEWRPRWSAGGDSGGASGL
jgi:hypothetical protein